MTPVLRLIGAAKLPPLQIGQDESGHISITGDITNPNIASTYNNALGYRLMSDENGNSFLDFDQGLFFRRFDTLNTTLSFTQGGHIGIHETSGGLGAVSGVVYLYAVDGELYVLDDQGNQTGISPHSFDGVTLHPDDPLPIVVDHHNQYLGTHQKIYLSRLAQLVEQLTGEQLIFEQPSRQPRDWAADETAHEQQRQAEIAAYDQQAAILPPEDVESVLGSRPEPYTPRPEPDWIADRKNGSR